MIVINNVYIRIKLSGFLIIVYFIVREKIEVEKMKFWFDDELKKMIKISVRFIEIKRKIFIFINDCIIF